MKVVFISVFINEHQVPLCNELYKYLKDDFKFIALEPLSCERKRLGYLECDNKPFVIKNYEKQNQEIVKYLLNTCDVLIVGSAPEKYFRKRLKQGKLVFKYSERYFKYGTSGINYFRSLICSLRHIRKYQKFNFRYLCASAYTSSDVSKFANYDGRMYKWGYFPEFKEYNLKKLFEIKEKKGYVLILWVGRFINWKHPEKAIEVAKYLKNAGIEFKMEFIGRGELESEIKDMISKFDLKENVEMLGAMSTDNVRKEMEKADIYLFTSDFNEGWGVVLNEAMNAGCAVVASHAIGSVPFLIRDGYNGLIYENGNSFSLITQVEKIIEDQELRKSLGENAYKTLCETWNAEVAIKRFLKLVELILNESEFISELYKEGPCSISKNLKNGWFKYEKNKG